MLKHWGWKKETETEKELMLMTGVCITGQMSYGSSSEGEMCINDMVNATDLVINQWTGEWRNARRVLERVV